MRAPFLIVMPDLFRHPPRGNFKASAHMEPWTPEQVRGDDSLYD